MRTKSILLGSFSLVLWSGLTGGMLFAQTTVQVDASRIPASPATVGASVTILYPRENLIATLAQVPGLAVRNEGGGAYLSPSDFGENGFERLTILVDGVPYNNPDMAPPDLSVLPWQDVERVEVYSNAVWWGGLGTVINIIMKPAVERLSGTFSAQVNNRLGHQEYARVNVPFGADKTTSPSPGSISLEASNQQTVSAQASNNSWTPSAGFGINWKTADFSSRVHYSYSRKLFDLPGSLTSAQFSANPNQAGSYGGPDNVLVENRLTSLTRGLAFGGRFDLPLGIFSRQIYSVLVSGPTLLTQGSAGLHERWTLPLTADDYVAFQVGFDETQSAYQGHTQTTSAGGGQVTWSLHRDRIVLQATARPQLFTNDGAILPDVPISASIVWNTPWSKVFLTAAHTVRDPVLDEQFNLYGSAWFTENPQLLPETGTLYDAGFVVFGGRLPHWSLEVDPTYLRLDNEIAYNGTENVNLPGTSTHAIVVVKASATLTSWLKSSASYTFTDARDASGAELPLISAHTVALALESPWAGVEGTWFSPYTAMGSAVTVSARTALNAWAAVPLRGGWILTAKAQNLLNDRTPSEVYYGGWYPTEAATYSLGFSWNF